MPFSTETVERQSATGDDDADPDVPLRTGWEDEQTRDGTWNQKEAFFCRMRSRPVLTVSVLCACVAALGLSLLMIDGDHTPPTPPTTSSGGRSSPAPPPPSAECLAKTCGSNSSWDLDDGPCVDVRPDSTTFVAAYERTLEFARQYYAYSAWKRFDWGAARRSGLLAAQQADSTGDAAHFGLALKQLQAYFPDGHVETGYVSKRKCGHWAKKTLERLQFEHIGGGFGLTVAQVDGGEIILTSVTDGSPAARAGLAVGNVVVAIDGELALQRVQSQDSRGWMWAFQNPATKLSRLAEQFRTIARAPVGHLRTWATEDGHKVSLTAEDDGYHTWQITAPSSPFFPPPPSPSGDHSVVLHYHMLSSEVGYIGIGEEEVKKMPLLMATALTNLTLQGAQGIVLDIRGNDGGDDDQGAEVINFFVPSSTPKTLYERASYSNRLLSVAQKGTLRKYMNGSSLDPDVYGAPVGNMCDGDPCELFTKHVRKSKYADKVSGFQGSFEGPVVAMINRYCDSTCEGIAMGISQLDHTRAAVTGFEGTLGSFGMSGGTIMLPGDFTFEIPFGRSIDANDRIQLDSDWTGAGGVLPTRRLVRNATNLIAFVQQRAGAAKGDVELDWAMRQLHDLMGKQQLRRTLDQGLAK